MNPRKLAVLLPVFNDDPGLRASLASLERETIPFDVYVVDDGSTPPIEPPPQLGNGAQVHLLRLDRNQGIAQALIQGIEMVLSAGHEYVARLDAGDINIPGRFTEQLEHLEREPHIALLGTAAEFVDHDGTLLFVQKGLEDAEQLRRRMHFNNLFCHPTVIMRSSALREVGNYSDEYPGAEDYDLFFRISLRHTAVILTTPWVRTLASDTGISRSRRNLQLRSRLRIQRKFFAAQEPWAYVGILTTLGLLAFPNRFVDPFKRTLHRLRGVG